MKEFTGNTEAEVWQQVTADMAAQGEVLKYRALLSQPGSQILLDLDIDLGGGFESGISTTTFQAAVPAAVSLRFHLHEQDLLHEIGKVLGMEDLKLGYPDFDAAFIVQTNQPTVLKRLFADTQIRQLLQTHVPSSLKLEKEEEKATPVLTFRKDEAMVETAALQEVYHGMRYLLRSIVG